MPKIKRATVVIHYGDPVYIKNLDREDQKNIGNYFQKLISDTYFEDKERFQDKF